MWLHVVGELVLAAACAWAAFHAWCHRAGFAVCGFALLGTAALLGASVYAGVQGAAAAHTLFTAAAGRLGLLLIAAKALRGAAQVGAVIAVCVVAWFVPDAASLGISVLALVAIAWKGRSRHWLLAIAGAVLFALVGLVVGTRGTWMQIPRVDLYHLGLATAVMIWTLAGVAHPSAGKAPGR
jgi:hypothetical protein